MYIKFSPNQYVLHSVTVAFSAHFPRTQKSLLQYEQMYVIVVLHRL